ncbi:uncharacterized protein LOC134263048, partial [Saccostrea cucullata]|uniref:uncharacterized protein LOC134263048 n=1 Tax=Saccostrea cuccullata TaxID=36930 RepID=UPI002ED55DF4
MSIIKNLYDDATCHIIHNRRLTDPFNVETGVRQGYILSSTIYLIVIDWIMQETTKGSKNGIQWTFTKQLEDLDFADDIDLLSHKLQDAQEKLSRLAPEAQTTGLKINTKKAEVIKINEPSKRRQ